VNSLPSDADPRVNDALSRPFVDTPSGRMLYSTGTSHLLSAALPRWPVPAAVEWAGGGPVGGRRGRRTV